MQAIQLKNVIIFVSVISLIIASSSILGYNYLTQINQNQKPEGGSITIKHADSYQYLFFAPTDYLVYSVNITFDLHLESDLNVTYGCSSPFLAKLVNNEDWRITSSDCEAIFMHQLENGTTQHSLLFEITSNSIQSGNSLSNKITVEVILAQNLITSSPFTFELS